MSIVYINLSGLESGGGLAIVRALLKYYIPKLRHYKIKIFGRKRILASLLLPYDFEIIDFPRPLLIISDLALISSYLLINNPPDSKVIVVNFSDTPIITGFYQVLFLDWPYAMINIASWPKAPLTKFILRLFKRLIYEFTKSHVNYFICQTGYIKSLVLRSGVLPQAIAINPIGVGLVAEALTLPSSSSKLKKFNSFKSQFPKVVLCPNAFNCHKGFEQIAQLLTRKLVYQLKLGIVLLADPADFKSQDYSSIFCNSGNVLLMGTVSREEMSVLYSMSSLIVNPSQLETFGFAYYEAAFYGKRQIVPDCPYVPAFAKTYAYENHSLNSLESSICLALNDEETQGNLDTTSFINVLHKQSLSSILALANLVDSVLSSPSP